jgi:6-phosphogluconolactonase
VRHTTTVAGVREHAFESTEAQVRALCEAITAQLRQALDQRPVASLAVSGGRSPVPLFQALARQNLPWPRIVIVLVDERCLPAGDPERNATLVSAHLLQGAAAQAPWIDWLRGCAEPQAVPDDALLQLALAQAQALALPLDVVVLGMGDDGHTASWFAHSPGLEQALHGDSLLSVVKPTTAPHRRLTLTRRAVTEAGHRHLTWSGPRKAAVYRQARLRRDDALPVSWLLHGDISIDVWYTERP